MFVEDYPYDRGAGESEQARLGALRVRGGFSLGVAAVAGKSRLADLDERGGYRVKLPMTDHGLEAIVINTGGGLVGGDEISFSVSIGSGAGATVATQSAERVYRAMAGASRTEVRLTVAANAALTWLPQETILYDGARLRRRIDADMAGSASLLMVEAVVFGREAMGEAITSGAFRDRWTIRRDGVPVFVEAVSLEGDMQALLQRRALGAGARAAGTVLLVAPDAEARRDGARARLDRAGGRAAVSAWNGMLVGRLLAASAAQLRRDLVALVTYLSGRPMPRVWNC